MARRRTWGGFPVVVLAGIFAVMVYCLSACADEKGAMRWTPETVLLMGRAIALSDLAGAGGKAAFSPAGRAAPVPVTSARGAAAFLDYEKLPPTLRPFAKQIDSPN